MKPLITLIEGNSVAPEVVSCIAEMLQPDDTVLVLLDSNHSKAHVAAELEAYSRFVTPGSYIVATDGLMRDLHDVPNGKPSWRYDNPVAAAEEFAAGRPDFVIERPTWRFNESPLTENVSAWPSAWLRRV